MTLDLSWKELNNSTLKSAIAFCFDEHITRVDLSGNDAITDISCLSKYPNIKALDLSNTSVNNSSLEILNTFKELKELYITSTEVDDITHIICCKQLKKLSLFGLEIESLVGIEALSRLEELDISNTLVSDLTPVSTLKNLTSLTAIGLENVRAPQMINH